MIALLTTAVILAIYLLRLDAVVGMFKDDGWYVVLAESLAKGKGYHLVSVPQHSGFYFYPPFFPFLLSLLYRISPAFPGNAFLLKSLSIASGLLLAPLLFRFFRREDRLPPSLAYLLAFTVAVAPSLVMLATSTVMSECVFTLLQFVTLLLAERCVEQRRTKSGFGAAFATGLLASTTYLTRTIGIGLLAAIAIDLARRKMFKPLVVFLLAVFGCVAPWTIYRHLTPTSGLVAPGYSEMFWSRLAGSSQPTRITPRELPARFWQLSTVIVGDDVGAMLMPSLYRAGNESGEEVAGMTAVVPAVSRNAIGLEASSMGLNVSGQILSLGLSLVVFVGFLATAKRGLGAAELTFLFSLAIIVAFPWPPMRYLVPLLPFFLFYFLVGVAEIYRMVLGVAVKPTFLNRWQASRVAALVILGLFLIDHGAYILALHQKPSSSGYPGWVRDFNAFRESAAWMENHTAEDEIVSGDNFPTTYLYSRRLTDMCNPAECAKKGIRYYLRTEGEDIAVPSRTAFQSKVLYVNVLDLSHGH